MTRSVVYQETTNNFTDTRQNIKGAQITTIKAFGMSAPSGGGDFLGQLGTANTAQGETLLYVYNGVEWKLVGQSGDGSLPDTVVQENMKNNFTEVDQRIEDCPITYMDSGTRDVSTVAIKGQGHIYVYESNPPKVYISLDGADWTELTTEHSTVAGDVKLDAPNNFTDGDQKIMSRDIATIIKGPSAPDLAVITPSREGEVYLQLAEGTSDNKARMWIAVKTTGNAWKWEPLSHIFQIPNTVAQTSKVNNFEPVEQKIAGNQILSFIDGGDLTPGQSGAKPDFNGQFYIAVHTNTQGLKDAAIWVAEGNQWLPIQQDMDLPTVARTDKSNRFAVPEQLLGEGGPNARHLIGARVKFSGASPIADNKWKVQNIGEITVYENNSVSPRELSIWMGVSKNPDPDLNLNEWALVWSSKMAMDGNYAKLNESNEFAPMQYISNTQRKSLINVGHEGGSVDPVGRITPMAPGDTFTQSYSDPGSGETRNIWIAAIEGDTQSWKRILCEGDGDVAMTDRPNNFKSKDNFIGLNTDTKRKRIMGARVNNTAGTVYNGVAPTMFGEVVVCEEWDPTAPSDVDKIMVRAYIAVGTERKSWIMIGERLKKDLSMIDDGTNN